MSCGSVPRLHFTNTSQGPGTNYTINTGLANVILSRDGRRGNTSVPLRSSYMPCVCQRK